MTKAELIEAMAQKENLPRAQVERMVHHMLDTILATMKGGGEVVFTGFGSFMAKQRASRMGVNPKTGEKIQIPAMTVPKFKAGKAMKDALKGGM
jgi:DNA-binding protein HU-beta